VLTWAKDSEEMFPNPPAIVAGGFSFKDSRPFYLIIVMNTELNLF